MTLPLGHSPLTPPPSAQVVFHELITLWQNHETRRIYPIGRLRFDGTTYEFEYVQGFQDTGVLAPLPGLPSVSTTYRSDVLFPAFAGRIMRPTRADFAEYLHRLGLDKNHGSPWEQITYGGGRRNGDTFHFLPMPTTVGEKLHTRCQVHGIRHLPGTTKTLNGQAHYIDPQRHDETLSSLQRGDVFTVVPEPTNPVNQQAALVVRDLPLGYIPDVLANGLTELTELGVPVKVSVAHVNPAYCPPHLRLAVNLEWENPPHNPYLTDPALQPLADQH